MTLRGLGAAVVLGLLVVSGLSCSATANVSDVYMSLDEDGSRKRQQFFTDSEAIYCIAEVGVGRKDVTLEILIRQATWDPQFTGELELTNQVVGAIDVHPDITTDKPALIGLKLVATKSDETEEGKPEEASFFYAGEHRCEVKLDGQPAGTSDFVVSYPPCPTKVITQGAECAGFYPIGQECPQGGATTDTGKCTCVGKAPTGKWDCR